MPPVLQRLIQPPRLRSEDGLEPGRRVTWMELFFDLIFVAAVAQVGTHLRDDYSPAGLLRFSLLFVMIWWSWLGHTNFSTRFDTDDLIQRSLTALQIFLVAVMAINATGPLDGRDSAGFVAVYAAMRLVLALQYFRVRGSAVTNPRHTLRIDVSGRRVALAGLLFRRGARALLALGARADYRPRHAARVHPSSHRGAA